MNASQKLSRQDRSIGFIRKSGRVDFPPDFGDFKLGQRVYFHLRLNEVALAKFPKRSCNGRLLSCRIRRGLRSLAQYGPRAAFLSRRR